MRALAGGGGGDDGREVGLLGLPRIVLEQIYLSLWACDRVFDYYSAWLEVREGKVVHSLNRLYAIDANWHHAREPPLTPIGVSTAILAHGTAYVPKNEKP